MTKNKKPKVSKEPLELFKITSMYEYPQGSWSKSKLLQSRKAFDKSLAYDIKTDWTAKEIKAFKLEFKNDIFEWVEIFSHINKSNA